MAFDLTSWCSNKELILKNVANRADNASVLSVYADHAVTDGGETLTLKSTWKEIFDAVLAGMDVVIYALDITEADADLEVDPSVYAYKAMVTGCSSYVSSGSVKYALSAAGDGSTGFGEFTNSAITDSDAYPVLTFSEISGGGGGFLLVNGVYDEEAYTITLDKTAGEILDAMHDGVVGIKFSWDDYSYAIIFASYYDVEMQAYCFMDYLGTNYHSASLDGYPDNSSGGGGGGNQ